KGKGISLAEYEVPPRDFRRFLFAGIARLHHNGVAVEKVELISTSMKPAWAIESWSLSGRDNVFEFSLETHYDSIAFTFEELCVSRRLGKCRVDQGKVYRWYTDTETGREFDFYDPFPND